MSVTTPPPPDESQIQAWQEQWNETKSEYQAEIDFMTQTLNNKTQEYQDIFNSPEEWNQISLQERSDLRKMIILAQQELQQIKNELQDAKNQFISVNPKAEHYVQF